MLKWPLAKIACPLSEESDTLLSLFPLPTIINKPWKKKKKKKLGKRRKVIKKFLKKIIFHDTHKKIGSKNNEN